MRACGSPGNRSQGAGGEAPGLQGSVWSPAAGWIRRAAELPCAHLASPALGQTEATPFSPHIVTACLLVQLPLTCGDFSFPTHPQDHDPLFAALGPLGTASTKPRICIFLQQKGRRTSPSGAAWLAPGCCCWAFPSSHHSSGLLCLSRACTAGPGVAPAGQTVSSVPHQPPDFP